VDGQRIWCLWDDAMISMRYAENWVRGNGLVWNPDETPVQGYTNLGVTLVMAAVHLLPVSRFNSSLVFQLINLVSLLVVAALSGRIAERLFSGLAGPLATLAVLCSAPLAIWALQGADTGLMALWLTACVCQLVGGFGRPQKLWITVLLFAVGPVLRLDAMVFVAPMWLYLAIAVRETRLSVATVGFTALTIAGLMGFSMLAYGQPLPNTYYLKTAGAPIDLMLARGLESLVSARSLWPLLVLASAAIAAFRRDPRVLLCGSMVATIAVYNTLVGGDWADEYVSRFMVPALPMLFVLCAGASSRALERLETRFDRPRGLVCVTIAAFGLLCLYVNPSPAWEEWRSISKPTMWRAGNQQNADLAFRLGELLAPTEQVAVHWAGVLPYLRTGRALDVLGKNEAHIARVEMKPRPTQFMPGHSKWDWDYVLDQNPEVVISASRGLKQHPRFMASYLVIIDQQDPMFRFFVRRDVAERIDTKRYYRRSVLEQS
jgi:arabinofuranosyltransferase